MHLYCLLLCKDCAHYYTNKLVQAVLCTIGCRFMHCQSDPNLFCFLFITYLFFTFCACIFELLWLHCESFFKARFFLRFSSLLIFTSYLQNKGFGNMRKNGNWESFFKKQDFSWDFLGAFSSLLVFSSRDTFHNVY